MEARHSRCAACFRFVVDKGTVAFGYQEDAFNVICRISRKVILEIYYVRCRWKIANP